MLSQNGEVALVENNRGWVVFLDLNGITRMGSQGEPDQPGQGIPANGGGDEGGAPTRHDLQRWLLHAVWSIHC